MRTHFPVHYKGLSVLVDSPDNLRISMNSSGSIVATESLGCRTRAISHRRACARSAESGTLRRVLTGLKSQVNQRESLLVGSG